MERVLTAVVLGSLAFGQAVASQSTQKAVASENVAGRLVDIPPLPGGKSTILGGAIRTIDPVKDQFVLHVVGQKPLKILFDERTQVYRDGVRIPLHDLKPAEHASVQTTLDGAQVFAISIHILSKAAEGQYQGRIEDFDPGSGRLMLSEGGTGSNLHVFVTKDTSVVRQGQSAFTSENRGQSDLVRGALVSLEFQPDNKGQGIASKITILATPGAAFVFSGSVTALNVAQGYVVVLDPRDQQSYQIHFDPQNRAVQNLHAGDNVRISAEYDGTRYIAKEISAM